MLWLLGCLGQKDAGQIQPWWETDSGSDSEGATEDSEPDSEPVDDEPIHPSFLSGWELTACPAYAPFYAQSGRWEYQLAIATDYSWLSSLHGQDVYLQQPVYKEVVENYTYAYARNLERRWVCTELGLALAGVTETSSLKGIVSYSEVVYDPPLMLLPGEIANMQSWVAAGTMYFRSGSSYNEGEWKQADYGEEMELLEPGLFYLDGQEYSTLRVQALGEHWDWVEGIGLVAQSAYGDEATLIRYYLSW